MKNKQWMSSRRGGLVTMWLLFIALTVGNWAHGQLAYWDPTGLASFGTSPWAATTTNSNLTVTGLTRGAGVTTSGTAAPNAWGGNGWTGEATDDMTWTMTANTGFQQSLSNFSMHYRRSSTAAATGDLQYAIGAGAYTSIGSLSFPSTATGGGEATLALSSVSALQNVPAGTVVKMRIVPGLSTNSSGTFYVSVGGTGLTVSGTVTAMAAPCAVPTGLTAANVTSTTADLSWTAPTGATGYEYTIDQTATAPSGAGTATTSTSFSASALTPSTTYYLHVRTNCGSGNYSSWVTISFTTLVTPCAAPTGLVAGNITDVSADLTWVAQSGVAGYEYVLDQLAVAPAGAGTPTTATLYSASGLTATTTYYIHVRTNCGSGNYSSWTTLTFNTGVAPCIAPSGLTAANITSTTADLSWASQASAVGYEYLVNQTPSVAPGTTTTGTTYAATGLTASTTYYLHVRTDCGGGNESNWTTISFTTLVAPCAAPTGLAAANMTDATADLSWNTQAGVAGYEYVVDQASTDPAGAGTVTTATTYSATGLTQLTTYYLHVRTDCGGGNLSPWSTVSFTTLVTPCAAPTGLATTNITNASADLSWNTQAGVAGYEYVVNTTATDPTGTGTATTATTYGATGLTASTTYYLHVRTNCGSGNYSSWVTISFTTLVTPCAAPTGLVAGNITDVSADLTWVAQSGVAGYEYVLDQLAAAPSGAGTSTTATLYSASGLTATTTYYIHVRTNCGSGNYSSWTTLTFNTGVAPCIAPSGLTAANITSTTADLSWASQASAVGYEYLVNQTPSVAPGTTTTGTTYGATGLTPSTTYYLHVRTDCGGGNESNWTTISFTTTATPCAATSGLTAANVTDMTADLSWTAQAGVAGYLYVVDQTAGCPSAGSATATTATTINTTGLTPSTTYYLHVFTDCGSGNVSAACTTMSFTTIATPCAAPTGLTAGNITDATADLSWNAQTGVAGYEYVVDQTATAPTGSGTVTTGTTYSATGLTAATTYYLHVRTNCGGANFSSWVTISFTTAATPCAAPTGLTAGNITDATADLSWNAQTGVAGYEYVVDQTATTPTGSGTVTTGTTYSATGLTASTTYYLHVRTNCGGANFSPWTTISFTTAATPCAAPTGLTAGNITDATADLSWNAQTGVAGYEYVVDQTATAPTGSGTTTTGTTYSATGLTENTTYYLHVRTNCGGANFSSWVTIPFTTIAAPCAAPTGLTAVNITDATADLSWNAVAGAAGYEYAVNTTATAPTGSGMTTTVTTYTATGLTESTTYYLHVRTNCGGGNFSPWVTIPFTTTATPTCAAPTGLAVANITDASADVSWASQTGVTGYEYVVDQVSSAPTGAGTASVTNAVAVNGLSEVTTYYVHIRTNCGGGLFSPWVTITFTSASSAGLEELEAGTAFTAYPNPVTDQLTVQTTGKGIVTLTNLEGQLLTTLDLEGTATIDVSQFQSGVYFVRYQQNGSATVRRIVKQ